MGSSQAKEIERDTRHSGGLSICFATFAIYKNCHKGLFADFRDLLENHSCISIMTKMTIDKSGKVGKSGKTEY